MPSRVTFSATGSWGHRWTGSPPPPVRAGACLCTISAPAGNSSAERSSGAGSRNSPARASSCHPDPTFPTFCRGRGRGSGARRPVSSSGCSVSWLRRAGSARTAPRCPDPSSAPNGSPSSARDLPRAAAVRPQRNDSPRSTSPKCAVCFSTLTRPATVCALNAPTSISCPFSPEVRICRKPSHALHEQGGRPGPRRTADRWHPARVVRAKNRSRAFLTPGNRSGLPGVLEA